MSARESLCPSLPVAVKLASLAVHADEMLSSDGHAFDREAIKSLLSDPYVREYLAALDGAALLPKKRGN